MTGSLGNGWRPALDSPDREQDAITMAALAAVTVKTMMAPNIFRMAISFLWMGGRPDAPVWLAACRDLLDRHPTSIPTS
jgi:hypothetical protein